MLVIIYILVILNTVWLFLISKALYQKNKLKLTSNPLPPNSGCKINITRFNPFENVGGNQSFILTILDESNSGVILTSLHNRDLTRVYAKQVKNGQGENNTLSKEEKLAIVNTIKG